MVDKPKKEEGASANTEPFVCEGCGRNLEGFLVSCPYCGVPTGDKGGKEEREKFEKEFRDSE